MTDEQWGTGPDYYQLLHRIDDARPRSSSGFGPSGFHGLDCKTFRTLRGDQPVNLWTDKWAAIRGTAIHVAFAEAVQHLGPVEVPLELNGLRGNADHLPDGEDVVVDLKTTTSKKLKEIKANGPPKSHLAQINWYAAASGRSRWRLVYAPMDQGRGGWHVVEGDYDKSVVDEALAWLVKILFAVRRDEAPEPGASAFSFCRSYCEFYDKTGVNGCPSSDGPAAPQVLPELFGGSAA